MSTAIAVRLDVCDPRHKSAMSALSVKGSNETDVDKKA
jgi:hypothetical protein